MDTCIPLRPGTTVAAAAQSAGWVLILEPHSAVLPPANCPQKLMERWCSSTTQEEVQAQHTLKKCVILFVHFQS